MKNKILNVNRQTAMKFGISDVFVGDKRLVNVLDNPIWISISEPDMPQTIISNPILEKQPHLKLSFWDVSSEDMSLNGRYFPPPSEEDAKKIVDFILENPGRDILVNCMAGLSRSSAVCKFCSEQLDLNPFHWLEEGRSRARPNKLLEELMIKYYSKLWNNLTKKPYGDWYKIPNELYDDVIKAVSEYSKRLDDL